MMRKPLNLVPWMLLLLVAIDTACLSASPQEVSNSSPVVYSGNLRVKNGDEILRFIARLHLIPSGFYSSGVARYRATMIYHLGDDASNEYVAHHYLYGSFHVEKRQLILSGEQLIDPAHRYPVIVLQFDQDGFLANGTVDSLGERIGELDLKSGWEYPAENVEMRYGGIYSAVCSHSFGGVLDRTNEISIVPSRMNGNTSDIDAFDNDMFYSANGLAFNRFQETGSGTSTAFLPIGRSILLKRRLIFSHRTGALSCRRIDAQHLSCTGTHFGECKLKKKFEIHQSLNTRNDIPFDRISFARHPKQSAQTNSECESLPRKLYGYLNHRIGDRLQPISVQIGSYRKYDTSGSEKCFLTINAHLAFDSWKWSSETLDQYSQGQLVFRFEPIPADLWGDDIVLRSISPQEISLRLKKTRDGKIHFSWYSDVAGYIGELFLSENPDDPALPEVGKEKSVHGIVGAFSGERSKSGAYDKFQIRAFARSVGPARDPNPYGSMQFEGIYKHFGVFNQSEVKVLWSPLVPTNYFDYYTGPIGPFYE